MSTGSTSIRLATASFVLVFVVAAVTFGYTWQGQTAFMERTEITAHGNYEVTSVEDHGTVTVRLQVENPTSKPIRITSGSIFGTLDGEQIVRDDTGGVSNQRIPAGGNRTFTVQCHFVDRSPNSTTVSRIRQGEMRIVGLLGAEMVDKRFDIEVTPDE